MTKQRSTICMKQVEISPGGGGGEGGLYTCAQFRVANVNHVKFCNPTTSSFTFFAYRFDSHH